MMVLSAHSIRVVILLFLIDTTWSDYRTHCANSLQMGQFMCSEMNIDPLTQEIAGCTSERTAIVNCSAVEGIVCEESGGRNFEKTVTCRYTNGYSFEKSLLLSVFLGMFGADRFYLGYPGVGLLKLCTLGFMLVGQLVDVLLIAMQLVGPADGSDYVISRYGPVLEIRSLDEHTYRLPQPEW